MEQHKSITSLAALLLASVACGAMAQTTPPELKDVKKPEPAITQTSVITSPIDESRLKQVVEDPGKGQPDRMRTDGVQGLDSGTEIPTKKGIHDKPVNDKATITRGRYADTFGADRINNANQGSLDLGHGTRDPAMSYKGIDGNPAGRPSDEQQYKNQDVIDKNPLVKGNQWGGNTYAQTDGAMGVDALSTDAVVGFMSFDKNGNLREIKVLRNDGKTVTASYDAKGHQKGDPKVEYPNPEAEMTAGGIVVFPGTSIATLIKRSKVAGGKAGGSGDGRDPNANTGGTVSEQAGKSIMMGKTGGNESKQTESGGAINMNKVLEINTKINPVRQ